jgi:hypothetical protein
MRQTKGVSVSDEEWAAAMEWVAEIDGLGPRADATDVLLALLLAPPAARFTDDYEFAVGWLQGLLLPARTYDLPETLAGIERRAASAPLSPLDAGVCVALVERWEDWVKWSREAGHVHTDSSSGPRLH